MALLVVERFERDTREIVGRVIRLLAPAPGRLEFAARLAAVCVLTTLIVQTYGTPDPALTVYVAFFMIKPDRVSSIITDIVFMVVITTVIGLIFLVSLIVVDEASLRVASMALVSFALLFLTSASKFEPVGPTAALIVGYGLDLLGSTPAGELATRAYLYAWLFVGIPACTSIVCNMLFGPSPLSLARRALALRMRVAARALAKPDRKMSKRCDARCARAMPAFRRCSVLPRSNVQRLPTR
jgi:multidrug resistance protein MdtO